MREKRRKRPVRGTAIELQGSTWSGRCSAEEISSYGADVSAARSGDRAYRLVLRSRQRSEIAGALVPSKGGFLMPAPTPPFTRETAIAKVRMAEDGWNSRDPHRVSLAYTEDSRWRNRAEFINGRAEIVAFLTRKWQKELDYRLIKEMWAFGDSRIAVRFAYEWHDDSGNWFRAYGNENWEFDADGVMQRRFASINDLPIKETDRKYHWPLGRRPDDHLGLSDLGL